MCEFVSWVEEKGKVYFLTGDQLFRSERGRLCREQSGSPDDYNGHGIIRLFYDNLKGGRDRECIDFSSPLNFPMPIRLSLISGEMSGFPFPIGLLGVALLPGYQAKLKMLDDEDEYWAKRKPIDKDFLAKLKSFNDDYQAKLKMLDDEYWELIKVPGNRSPNWQNV